jgi:hypothetical protein
MRPRPRHRVRASLLRYAEGAERDEATNRPVRTETSTPIVVSAPQPIASTEAPDVQGQAWRLFVWTDTAIAGSDRIRVADVTYEVVGDPGVWRVGSTFHHQEAVLTRSR